MLSLLTAFSLGQHGDLSANEHNRAQVLCPLHIVVDQLVFGRLDAEEALLPPFPHVAAPWEEHMRIQNATRGSRRRGRNCRISARTERRFGGKEETKGKGKRERRGRGRRVENLPSFCSCPSISSSSSKERKICTLIGAADWFGAADC